MGHVLGSQLCCSVFFSAVNNYHSR